jgi:hypothetical protein
MLDRGQGNPDDRWPRGKFVSDKIRSFRDLTVYKLAFKLQQEIFEISKHFPPNETYSLTDQIRRASRSIGAILPKLGRSVATKLIL